MKKSKLYLTSIEKEHPDMLYEELYAYVRKMIDDGKLSLVKSARTNGRKPALPLVFWKYEEEKNYDCTADNGNGIRCCSDSFCS